MTTYRGRQGLMQICVRDLGWGIGIYVTGLWYGGPLIQVFVKGPKR